MKNVTKRLFSLLLCALMVLTLAAPLSASAAEPVTYNVGVYQTGVNDKGKPVYSTNAISSEAANTRASYAAGDINWCVEGYSFSVGSGGKFYSTGGTKMMTYVGDYIVYRIKSPGAGVRSLTLKHGTFFRSGKVDIYIMPGSTTDVVGAMIPDNRVGRVDFYNENTNSTTDVKWNCNTVVGSYNFGNEAEYIVVMKASEATPIHPTMCYFYPTALTFTEGVQTPTQPAQRAHSVIVSDSPIKTFEISTYSATGMINGQPYIYLHTEGKKLFVYNLETGEKYDEVDTRFTVCRGITVDDEGRVWMIGSQYYLQCYDPYAKMITAEYSTQGNMESGGDIIYVPETGCLYFGSFMKAHIYEFNVATRKLRDLGSHNDDTSYACGIAYDNGYVYCGIVGNKNSDDIHTREVVKIRLSDGALVGRTDVSSCVNKKEIMIRGAAVVNGVYIAGGIEMDHMLAIDTETMELTELTYNGTVITNPVNFSVSESYNGEHYFSLKSNGYNYVNNGDGTWTGNKGTVRAGLYAMNDTTGEIRFVSNSITNSLPYGQDTIIDIYGDPCVFWNAGGVPRYYNLNTGEVTILSDLVSNTDGAPITIDSITTGAPGSNTIMIGAFNNDKCSVYNTETGTVVGNFYANGQSDCMIWYDGYLYVGNYKSGILTQIIADDEFQNTSNKNNKVLIDFRYSTDPNGEYFNQVRVHALAAGDGKVFAGTMPDSYLRGGCIGWYDTVTGETYIERNVVQNQSINSLVYHDGYLYGTTTTAGGTGSGADMTLSAKMFIYDVENKRKVAEIDLRDKIDGLPERLSYVSGIVADPNIDTNGKLWGTVAEVLYSFTFDEANADIIVKEELVLNKAKYTGGSSKGTNICFLDGYIYAYFGGSTLFLKMDYNDPTQYTALPVADPSHYVIGEDKNLYYSNDDTLYLYPLNVTDDDRIAASKVDTFAAALARPATLADKATVESVRAKYNALSWDQRTLVQNLYLLEAAETDVLEARIATLDLQNLDQALVNELAAIYDEMTKEQRSFVSNYSVLASAKEILSRDVYAIGKNVYNTLNAALEDAVAGDVIRMLCNHEENDVELTGGVTLDLNGYILVCDSFDSLILGNGYVIDSEGGRGLLMADELLLREDNTQMPLFDKPSGGYRFFAYSYTIDYTLESIGNSGLKVWYKMEFESDAAYDLIRTGHTGMEIGVELYWNNKHLIKALFGRGEPLSTETFCDQWAQAMQGGGNTWLYAQITGVAAFGRDGVLTIKPVVSANGVYAQAASGQPNQIVYEINAFDFGFDVRQ